MADRDLGGSGGGETWPPRPPANETTPESWREPWPAPGPLPGGGWEVRLGGPGPEAQRPPRRRRRWLPPLLFGLTCLSTYLVGGVAYAAAVMFILLCHELGHYVQARRHGVPASLPYFIPMPLTPIGTMGAVIVMRSRLPHRRALFDVAITGPLAGLVPTLVFVLIGLKLSTVQPLPEEPGGMLFGEPLLFRFLASLVLGPIPSGQTVFAHPLAWAGWVGMFITALNLLPVGQLDGGHILYALLRRRAHRIALVLLVAAGASILAFGYWGWSLLFLLLLLFGPFHPPTAADEVPLGKGRVILGWATLLFLVVGFTPEPFVIRF